MISTDVYVIPHKRAFLFYAPLKQAAFLGGKKALKMMKEAAAGIIPSGLELADYLKNSNFAGNLGNHPIMDASDNKGFVPAETGLFLSNSCNLRCTYCYASAGNHKTVFMDISTAKAAIDLIIKNASAKKLPSIRINYHGGGEPFSAWQLMKETYAYAKIRAEKSGLKVSASAATNGMLSKEQREWAVKNMEGLSVSLDGDPATQNKNRPLASGAGSFKTVRETLEYFDSMNFSYAVRITVTRESARRLERNVKFILKNFRPRTIMAEPVYMIGRGNKTRLNVSPSLFTEFFLKARSAAKKYGTELKYSAARPDILTNRFCLSCGSGFNITPDGLITACYEVSRQDEDTSGFIYGRYENNVFLTDASRLEALRSKKVENIAHCDGCFCRWHCAGDCPNKTPKQSAQRCSITREITKHMILEKYGLINYTALDLKNKIFIPGGVK